MCDASSFHRFLARATLLTAVLASALPAACPAGGLADALGKDDVHLPGMDYAPEDAEAMRGWLVQEIVLVGNLRTRDETVLRELFLQPGDAFDPELLGRDLRFLRGLRLFAAVGVTVRPDSGGVYLTYFLVERGDLRWGLVYPVAEFRNDQLRLGGVYRHRSLLGGREDLWLEYSAGWEQRARVSIGRPWLGSYPIEHGLSYRIVDRADGDQFHLERASLSFWLSLSRRRPLEHRFLFSLGWGERRFLVEDSRHYEQFSSVTLGYSHDSRDSFVRPASGGLLELTGTLYDPILGSSVYLRQVGVLATRYHPLGGWVAAGGMAAVNRWGDLFYRGVTSLGGLESVRGFGESSVDGWEGADGPHGPRGRNSLVARVELRHDLLPPFTVNLPVIGVVDVQTEGALFTDAGWLWSRDRFLLPLGARARLHSGGGALRLYTPVGDVVRLELGIGEGGKAELHLGSGMRF